jgi:hypothetical protein
MGSVFAMTGWLLWGSPPSVLPSLLPTLTRPTTRPSARTTGDPEVPGAYPAGAAPTSASVRARPNSTACAVHCSQPPVERV